MPASTSCADGDDFGSGALPAGVAPFRGFSTAADESEVGTPSPFGSAMAQRMAFRWEGRQGPGCRPLLSMRVTLPSRARNKTRGLALCLCL